MKRIITALMAAAFSYAAAAQSGKPLTLVTKIEMPEVIEGDFDHFTVDLPGKRLFLTAEDNHSVEVFDMTTNKRITTIHGVETPHSMLYLPSTNQLIVVDGGSGSLKYVDGKTYKITDTIVVDKEADSSVYDPDKHILWVISGGEDAKLDYCIISAIDVISRKRLGDIKIDSSNIEAMALEKGGTKIFANIRDKSQVGVIDRASKKLLTSWPLPNVKMNTPIAYDQPTHRVFVVGRKPATFVVLNSDNGKVVATLPSAPMADDMVWDAATKRAYVACDGAVSIFVQKDADHYTELPRTPTSYRAKTGILIPSMHRYYIAAPRHGSDPAKVWVFNVN